MLRSIICHLPHLHGLTALMKKWYCLCNNLTIPEKYRDHQLTGNLKDLRDCHIKPDLVLLYRKEEDAIVLIRMGSHSELQIS